MKLQQFELLPANAAVVWQVPSVENVWATAQGLLSVTYGWCHPESMYRQVPR